MVLVVARRNTFSEFPPGQHGGLVRIGPQEHEHRNSSDRNVEPYRVRPARNSAVHREPARQREKECGEDHGQSDDRKNYVAGQNGKVQHAHGAVAGKNRVAVQCMVDDVTHEKSGREPEGQQHARAMGFPVVMFDEIQARAERNGAQSVQKRIERRQKHPPPGEISRRMMHVEQPEQE